MHRLTETETRRRNFIPGRRQTKVVRPGGRRAPGLLPPLTRFSRAADSLRVLDRACRLTILTLLLIGATTSGAADYPAPQAGDCVLRDFHFRSGPSLPELRLHYLTLGTPQRDEHGRVRNAILILHGTTGQGGNFIRPDFAGELFGKGQLLDAGRYFIILPDNIGHGQSSRPSDGLHGRFPQYGYADMVEAQFRLVTEGLKVNHLRLVMGTSIYHVAPQQPGMLKNQSAGELETTTKALR